MVDEPQEAGSGPSGFVLDQEIVSQRHLVWTAAGALVLLLVAGIAMRPHVFALSDGLAHHHPVASHATRGVVKAIDATTLVITRPGRPGDVAFELSPSTEREGVIVAGSMVSVRYGEHGEKHVAIAIAVEKTSGR